MKISRREFTWSLLGSAMTYSLVRGLGSAGAVAASMAPVVRKWLVEMEEASQALVKHRIEAREWQAQIETLLGRVELKDLLKAVDYEHLHRSVIFPEDHESVQDVDLTNERGLPEELSFSPYFYGLKKGTAIVPHGHRNSATMHMVLSGEAHARHFDRISDDAGSMVIRPTHDLMLGVGKPTTISDARDNVHWFKALTGPVFMFNIGIFGVNPNAPFSGRDYVDPSGGELLPDGTMRVRRIEQKDAYRLYGKF